MAHNRSHNKPKKKHGLFARIFPFICGLLGLAMLIGVFTLTLPIAGAQLFGYTVYNVVSGSMEPAVPVNSIIYVKAVSPSVVQPDDIIAFNSHGNMVAHRVVTNRTTLGEFVTKGDANSVEDSEPTAYGDFYGRVEHILPRMGEFMTLYTSTVGKVYLIMSFSCGVMLMILGDKLRRRRILLELKARADELKAQQSPEAYAAMQKLKEAEEGKSAKMESSFSLRRVAMYIALSVFLVSTALVTFVMVQRIQSDEVYRVATTSYAKEVDPAKRNDKNKNKKPPITIDWDALLKANPDICGWIYCEGTVINYPVLHGKNNDQYLHHDYLGNYNIDGSIFMETQNSRDFSDAITTIYGHHMGYTGSMFTCLKYWQDQQWYNDHKVMWLLTPKQNYRVDLFSGRHTAATSDVYRLIKKKGDELNGYLQAAVAQSYFHADNVRIDPDAKYVTLSTCAYIFDNARFVLHGKLVPVK